MLCLSCLHVFFFQCCIKANFDNVRNESHTTVTINEKP